MERPESRGYISGQGEFLYASAPRLNLRPTAGGKGVLSGRKMVELCGYPVV